MKCRVAVACLAVLAGSWSVACSSSPPQRPLSHAQLVVIAPQPNEAVSADPTIQFQLIGGTVVPAATVSGPLRGDQGHIHVSVDGQLVSMAYGLSQQLHGLKPGPHSLQAEFVAVDHLPFRDRIVARTLFSVR